MCGHSTKTIFMISVGLLLILSALSTIQAQEKHSPRTAGVDDTKMGPYRALAQLAVAASQKGTMPPPQNSARILERTWIRRKIMEATPRSRNQPCPFRSIDKAMDQFIAVLLDHPNAAPDSAKLKALYTNYLDKLKLAD